jgi:hypothetical protein
MSKNIFHANYTSNVTSNGVAGGLEIFRSILHACDPKGFSDFQSGEIGKEEGYKARSYMIAAD